MTFAIAIAIALLSAQVSPASDRQTEQYNAEINAQSKAITDRVQAAKTRLGLIDAEVKAIEANKQVFEESASARTMEINTLRARYPDIKLSSSASYQEIYDAVYGMYLDRYAIDLPIMANGQKAFDTLICRVNNDYRVAQLRYENSADFQRLPLEDRLKIHRTAEQKIEQTDLETAGKCP